MTDWPMMNKSVPVSYLANFTCATLTFRYHSLFILLCQCSYWQSLPRPLQGMKLFYVVFMICFCLLYFHARVFARTLICDQCLSCFIIHIHNCINNCPPPAPMIFYHCFLMIGSRNAFFKVSIYPFQTLLWKKNYESIRHTPKLLLR